MKRKAVLGIVLLLLLISTLTLTFNIQLIKAEPTTIIVPDDYPTIKEAINAAGSGDTIVVQDGLYAEGEIVVSKPLTLIAEGTVIVDGLQTATSVFFITSHSVVIEGFMVRNARWDGIILWGTFSNSIGNCKIEGNTVTNSPVGIRVRGSSGNIVRGNKVLNNSVGILVVSGECHPPAKHNILEGNIVKNNSRGINFVYAHYNNVRGNKLENNNWGIGLLFSRYNIIKENTVANNNELGIGLIVSHHNLVKENKVTNNGLGIGLSGSGWNTVEENKVNGNTPYHGIALYWTYARNTIKENVAFGNEEFDLHWDGIGSNTWEENRYKTKNW